MQWYNIIRKCGRTVLSIALPPALPLWSWHCYGVVPPGHDQHTDNLLDSINDEIAAHFLLVIKSGQLVILSPVPMNSSSSQRSRAHLTSASSWCSTSSLGVKPHRLQSLDFTMMGSWPKDCLMMPLGTPLIDQLTSACSDRTMKAFPHTHALDSLRRLSNLPPAFLCMSIFSLCTLPDTRSCPCRCSPWRPWGCTWWLRRSQCWACHFSPWIPGGGSTVGDETE